MDHDARRNLTGSDRGHDRLKVELHGLERGQRKLRRQEGRRPRARHSDALAGEVCGLQLRLGNDDRTIALAEGGAVAQQAVQLLHAGIGPDRHRRRL